MTDRTCDGGPAFPVPHSIDGNWVREPLEAYRGMSLRAYFLAHVMQGFCANPSVFAPNPQYGWGLVNCSPDQLINNAKDIADEMIRALDAPVKEKE